MEWVVSLAHGFAWVLFIIFIFAFIGFVATIRWIIGLFTGAERAVVSGVESVGRTIERK
jgi:formate hydrogenlyase subunit 3/multisubunit Na+/H+ antiporter MnhD subunit